ncbi:hypothetical protein VTO73DRAFT_13732 [Trametes versicolor]
MPLPRERDASGLGESPRNNTSQRRQARFAVPCAHTARHHSLSVAYLAGSLPLRVLSPLLTDSPGIKGVHVFPDAYSAQLAFRNSVRAGLIALPAVSVVATRSKGPNDVRSPRPTATRNSDLNAGPGRGNFQGRGPGSWCVFLSCLIVLFSYSRARPRLLRRHGHLRAAPQTRTLISP